MSNKRPTNMNNVESEGKLKLAKKIAESGSHVQHTYENIESSILRIIHWMSGWVDKLLFNQKYSKLVAFVLAVLFYMIVNVTDATFGIATQAGYVLDSVPLTINVDDSVYEVSGLPKTVSASIVGEVSDITMLRNSNSYKVVADLTGLGEGTHEVDLIARDFSSKLNVTINPSNAIVTIRKKITRAFTLSYDFVNTNNLDEKYVLGTPVLSASEVMVRASEETLNQIAFVKALIDVSYQTESFSTETSLVAYDSEGNKLDVNIIPSTITAEVPISSPSKDVEVQVRPVGDIPNGLAIDSISLDHSSVTLYGPSPVLTTVGNIIVDIDASQLTKLGTNSYTAPITTPSGVNKMSVQRVVMEITLAEKTSRTISDVPINVINNTNGYRFNLPEGTSANTSITVYGTQAVVDAITADDLTVTLNMANVELGTQELQLSVTSGNTFISYQLVNPVITLEVVE